MALTIHYIGNVAFRQNKSPQWNKTYSGDMDICSLTFQGAQYLMKVFLDSLKGRQCSDSRYPDRRLVSYGRRRLRKRRLS